MLSIKERFESDLLKCLRILFKRMKLTEEEQKYYFKLEKGYLGEVNFDLLTEKLVSDCLIIKDLKLKINNTTLQIDTLIIYQNTIYLFEVKNYEGDYCYDVGKLLSKTGKEYKNPLNQLDRSISLLRQVLQDLGIHLTIEAYVVFVNPEFTLYQAPLNLPIIYPTQLNSFLKQLNAKPSRLNTLHKNLAEKLVSLHQTESPYPLLPPYEYHQLRKGITCKECISFSLTLKGKNVMCSECGFEELVESAVIRSVEEFRLLFPNRKITTNEIYEWCGIVECKTRISRILKRHFKLIGVHQWAYFE